MRRRTETEEGTKHFWWTNGCDADGINVLRTTTRPIDYNIQSKRNRKSIWDLVWCTLGRSFFFVEIPSNFLV